MKMAGFKQILLFVMYITLIGGKSTVEKYNFNNNNLGFDIDSHTPDQVVVEGQLITLMCRVKTSLIDGNDDWKTCRWSRVSDGATCLFEYKKIQDDIFHSHWIVEEYCESPLGDVEYFGSDPNVENHICGINIQKADQEDNSDFKCSIEECKTVAFGGCSATTGNNNIVEATMNVKVESPPPTGPTPTTGKPNECDQFGSCTFGSFHSEGPCEQCYCQCNESEKYEENCCETGLVFNPKINKCDWPFNNDECP